MDIDGSSFKKLPPARLCSLRNTLTIFGYVALQAASCIGPFGGMLITSVAPSWKDAMLLAAVFHLSMGISALGLRFLFLKGATALRSLPRRISCIALTLCYLVAFVAPLPYDAPVLLYGLVIIVGVAHACLTIQWFSELLTLYKIIGKDRFFYRLIAAFFFLIVLGLMCSTFELNRHPGAMATASLVATGVTFACLETLQHINTTCVPSAKKHPTPQYRLSSYAFAILLSFGATWGIAICLQLCMPYSRGTALWTTHLAVCAACCLGLMLLNRVAPNRFQFGAVIRLSISTCGLLLAALPVLNAIYHPAIPALGAGIVMLQSSAMTLFAVEACHETGLEVRDVFPLNFVVFSTSGCFATVFTAATLNLLDTSLAYDVIVLLAVAMSLMVIPMLPSQSSDAATFILKELPENEDYASRTARTRNNIVGKYGLSSRETEVLDLLLQGKTRQEIADALSISSWTVRDHTGSIYSKTGMHSAKELMALIGKGE